MYLSPYLGVDAGANVNSFVERTFSGQELEFTRYMTWRSGIAGMLIADVFLFVPVLMLVRRFDPVPAGSIALFLGLVTFAMVVLFTFMALPLAVGALGTGIAIDLAATRFNPGSDRGRFFLFAGVAPAVFWAVYMGVVHVAQGIGWPVNLWLGSIIWTALAATGMAWMMWPASHPVPRL